MRKRRKLHCGHAGCTTADGPDGSVGERQSPPVVVINDHHHKLDKLERRRYGNDGLERWNRYDRRRGGGAIIELIRLDGRLDGWNRHDRRIRYGRRLGRRERHLGRLGLFRVRVVGIGQRRRGPRLRVLPAEPRRLLVTQTWRHRSPRPHCRAAASRALSRRAT
jgi:hypothetical protein